MVAELLQVASSIGKETWGIATAVIPALIVYGVTKRDVRIAKEQVSTARDEAKKEFTEAITPALRTFKLEFKEELLKGMNGTYLRTQEALIHFGNIKDALARLEKHAGIN